MSTKLPKVMKVDYIEHLCKKKGMVVIYAKEKFYVVPTKETKIITGDDKVDQVIKYLEEHK